MDKNLLQRHTQAVVERLVKDGAGHIERDLGNSAAQIAYEIGRSKGLVLVYLDKGEVVQIFGYPETQNSSYPLKHTSERGFKGEEGLVVF